MAPLSYDKEFLEGLKPHLLGMNARKPPAAQDMNARREDWVKVQNQRYSRLADTPDVNVRIHRIPTTGFDQSISVYRIYPTRLVAESAFPSSAVIHAHSGGMILGSVHELVKRLKFQASDCNVQIFSVDYRLAPETPYPGPVEDCWAALKWLIANAKSFNVNPARITVMGESAGGNLMASIALKARDTGLHPPLAKQILIYPMLDDRTIQPNPELEKFVIWNHQDNAFAWAAYLGGPDKVGGEETDPYAAPARAKKLEGLPPSYVEVGGLDLFRDECIQYAGRLAQSNIDCELHVYPGVTHSFEAVAPDAPVSRRAWQNLRAALMQI